MQNCGGIFTLPKQKRETAIKTLKKIVILFILPVILLAIPVTVLRIDAIQHRLAGYISDKLTNELQLPIQAGKIEINFPDNLSIDSLLLKDLVDDTLAYIPHISANIELIPLIRKGEINIHTVKLAEPDIRITRVTPDEPLNLQFLIDRLSNPDTTGNKTTPDIRIRQIHLYDGRVSYNVHSEPESEQFTPSHINIDNLQANLALRTLTADSLSLYVRRISFDEASGFSLKRLRASIDASANSATLTRLQIKLPEGEITSKRITAERNGDNTTFSGTLASNKFTLKDLASIKPRLSHIEQPLKFNISFNGNQQQINIPKLQLSTTDNSFSTTLNGKAKRRHDQRHEYSIDLTALSLAPTFAGNIYKAATDGKPIPQELINLGTLTVKGKIKGTGKEVNGTLEAASEAGMLNADLSTNRQGIYNGTITATEINIGKITDNHTWGYCGINATVEGNPFDSIGHTATINTTITPLQYNNYTYSPIHIRGRITGKKIEAHTLLNDKNLKLDMDIRYDAGRELPRHELSLQVDSFSPYNLRLTEKHESSHLSFRIASEMVGKNPEQMRLNADIYDLTLNTPQKKSKINQFHLSANSLEQERSLIINSDFLNGYLTGYYRYETIGNSFKQALNRVLPSLFANKETLHCDNNFVFHFNIGNTDALTRIFDLPVTIKELSMLQGNCNDTHNLFTIAGNLQGIEYGKRKYRCIDFSSSIGATESHNKIKLIRTPIQSKKEEYNPNNEITIDINTRIQNDSIFSNLAWNNLYAPVDKGNVDIDIAMQRNNGALDLTAQLHEGRITQSDTLWTLLPSTIKSSNGRIEINNFSLQSSNQHIRVNGIAGKMPEDKLDVDLRHIDIEYVFDLINFHPVNLGGAVSGKVHASALLQKLNFDSDLQIKGLKFERGLIGDMALRGYWDEEREAIILKGDAREGNESRTIVDGLISPARDTLNICVEAHDTRIEFLNHMLSSFIGDAAGRANGKLYILGAMRNVNLKGALAPLGQLRIKPTNTVYNLTGDTIRFTHNKIGFDKFRISDNHGNKGTVSGGVHHHSLKRFTCDFDIKAYNLLAFHYPDFGNETFYGTAFVTGDANFSTNSQGMYLKTNVTTGPGSKFVYNASSPEGNINNEFVTFVDRKKRKSLIKDMEIFQVNEPKLNIRSNLTLDFMLNVTPNMQLRVYTNQASNDYIDIYGAGRINAIYDEKAGFSMQGNLGLTRGTYKFTLQDIFPKEFAIRSGSSVSFNGDPFNAKLNLKTVYTIPSVPLTDLSINAERRKSVKVNCFMDITGTIFAPNLAFNLELPDGNEEEKELLSSAISTPEQLNMQFIYLLGIGKFYTYDYNNQSTESQSSTAMESLISNTISGQLNNMLSQIIDNGNWNFSGNFTTSEKGWNSMEVEGMLSGRLLDNRLLINGNLGYRDNPMANKNFIGDFEVQWLLNKSGNISLKAYNKTNDRYFSKTTLTTQGAGILLKHEFDGWKFWLRQQMENR